tara:strand:- start:296 stop:700 length:405 start_codon:yes stop_codon:yes gene_type:complete
MATYHPPKIITTQASPAITADLAYEAHGKCGQTVVLNSNSEELALFDSRVTGRNAYKMVVLRLGDKALNRDCPCDLAGMFKTIKCKNIEPNGLSGLIQVPITQTFELYGNFEVVALDINIAGFVVVMYMDCEQS